MNAKKTSRKSSASSSSAEAFVADLMASTRLAVVFHAALQQSLDLADDAYLDRWLNDHGCTARYPEVAAAFARFQRERVETWAGNYLLFGPSEHPPVEMQILAGGDVVVNGEQLAPERLAYANGKLNWKSSTGPSRLAVEFTLLGLENRRAPGARNTYLGTRCAGTFAADGQLEVQVSGKRNTYTRAAAESDAATDDRKTWYGVYDVALSDRGLETKPGPVISWSDQGLHVGPALVSAPTFASPQLSWKGAGPGGVNGHLSFSSDAKGNKFFTGRLWLSDDPEPARANARGEKRQDPAQEPTATDDIITAVNIGGGVATILGLLIASIALIMQKKEAIKTAVGQMVQKLTGEIEAATEAASEQGDDADAALDRALDEKRAEDDLPHDSIELATFTHEQAAQRSDVILEESDALEQRKQRQVQELEAQQAAVKTFTQEMAEIISKEIESGKSAELDRERQHITEQLEQEAKKKDRLDRRQSEIEKQEKDVTERTRRQHGDQRLIPGK